MSALARTKADAPAPGRVLLRGVSWETYERLLDEHNEAAGPRLIYDDGFLEIMTLSIEHEQPSCTLALLVDLIAGEWNIDCRESRLQHLQARGSEKRIRAGLVFLFSGSRRDPRQKAARSQSRSAARSRHRD